MEINSTSITGYVRFLLLSKLRRWRPYGYLFKQEQMQIESWLALIAEAARRSGEFALEVTECARLIKRTARVCLALMQGRVLSRLGRPMTRIAR